MFFYIVFTAISTVLLPVYEVPTIRVNTSKSTYTFTSVLVSNLVAVELPLVLV